MAKSLASQGQEDRVSLERPTYEKHLKEAEFYAKLNTGGRRVWAIVVLSLRERIFISQSEMATFGIFRA